MDGQDKWAKICVDEIKRLNFKPDVIVADYCTASGVIIANDLNLPLVVNAPATLQIYELFSNSRFITANRSCVCCGILCACEEALYWFRHQLFMSLQKPTMLSSIDQMPKHMVLLNTFWGLEKPALLTPNVRVTGPLQCLTDCKVPDSAGGGAVNNCDSVEPNS